MNAETQLDSFMAKYSAEVVADARHALDFLQDRLPTALRLVYDNYNALVIGFASGEKASDAFLSIALYPKYVRLFFLRGVDLEDPDHLLEGNGAQVRSIKLKPAVRIEEPAVGALIDAAVANTWPLPKSGEGPLIIKSISPSQRPRRPTA